MTNEELIARTEASLEGVTPGPWEWVRGHSDWGMARSNAVIPSGGSLYDYDTMIAEVHSQTPYCLGASKKDIKQSDEADAKANFIAESRQLVPDLIAALRASEAHAKAGWALATHWQNRYTERAVADDAALRALKGGAK